MERILRKLFSRNTALRFLSVIVCLAALVVLIYVEEGWRGRRAWAAYQANAERRGVKLRFEDFVRPPVPDAENFAESPLFKEAFRDHESGLVPHRRFHFPAKGFSRQTWSSIERGTYIDIVAWREYFLKNELLDAASPDAARDVLRAMKQHYGPALQELREAGERPHSRFPITMENGIANEWPHFQVCLEAVRLIKLRMSAHLAAGESAAAYADFHDGLNLYRGLLPEPGLLGGIVRGSLLNSIETALWDGLANRQWAEPELRSLEADLAFGRFTMFW